MDIQTPYVSSVGKRVARAIRSAREAAGLSQESLAEIAGLNRGYLGEIERASANPSIVTLEKISKALNIPLAELLHNPETSGDA